MRISGSTKTRGFTLVEMTIAMAVGLVVLGAAVSLFSRALNASFIVTQRAEMQQNGRAALDMMAKDLSLAGAGVTTGGVQLPVGNGATASRFACSQVPPCYIANNLYPVNNHLFGAVPNPNAGLALTAGGQATDVVTVAYTDTTFALFQYNVALAVNGSAATFTVPVPPPNPVPVPWPPTPINDPAVGLKAGDLILFSNNIGSAVGEVTLVGNGGVVSFANNDPLNINQSGAASGRIADIAGGGAGNPTIAYRLLVITYFIDVPPGPDNIRYTADDGPPRLMRQVSGQVAMPVAENVAGLQLSYDIFDDVTGVATANLKDAGLSAGKSPNQIRKMNLSVMTRSPLNGGGGPGNRGFQSLNLATSVSARDMSFKDRYQ
jgi:prepilin-type N-terminal cleavage/methylation domain-containing protein